ncbi:MULTISPECIES: MFS transporter [unclassified Caballeronia]|uniref:MFS transporter n=1 Tax=unclassified Caballeronia TaxID=2646786 RepID=UPI00286306C9|nr:MULTISPECIES: MFS transporter [unclassified Caballeronia]MDR5752427.1 MFS transporter [Caballeronia sp. LZ024]MDR5845233.1 MFS transporter [Caballeronia sp. LZ031]
MKFHHPVRPTSPNTILGVVLIAYLMILLDLSIVYTGMPEIGKTMNMSPVMQTWVQNAYLLCFGGFLLLSARLGDTFGRRRILQVGVVLFTVASLMIGIAQSPYELIAARAVQGFGASILAPSVLAIISTTFAEGTERTRALAWYSIVAGAGASLGLVLGGIFAGLLSWRIGFLVNIPIGIGLLFAVARYIPDNVPTVGKFDVTGAIASTVGVGLLVYGLVNAAGAGWLNRVTLATLALSVVVLGFFLWHEGRVDVPVLPLRLLRSRERSAAYLARMLYVGSIVSFFFFGTQYMQRVLGYSALQAGLGFLPMTLVQFVAATTVPRVTRMFGGVSMLMGSLLVISVGLLWLATAGAQASVWQLALPMVLIGIGNGGAMAPLTTSGVRGVEAGDQGAASGLVNVAHQLGGSIGLSILIVVFAASADPQLTSAVEMSNQVSAVFVAAAMMNVLALVLTAVFILPANRKSVDPHSAEVVTGPAK